MFHNSRVLEPVAGGDLIDRLTAQESVPVSARELPLSHHEPLNLCI